MDTIWNWSWGWCLLPMIFFGVMALIFLARWGGCSCGCGRPRTEAGDRPPGSVPR